MTTPHTPTGDQDIREYIESNWTFIALIDDTGTEVTRIDTTNDSRATLKSDAQSNPVTIEVTVTGGDSDIPTPVTFAESQLFKTSGAANPVSGDTFTEGQATLQADIDELIVSHSVEQPQL